MKYFITIFFIITFISCNATKYSGITTADKSASPETRNLLLKIKKLAGKGIMFGHQDDLAYGHTWKYIDGKSDIKDVCGDYPAVFGWDLSLLETGSAHNIDSVPFVKIKEYVKLVNQLGGINTFSWHANNPVTGGNTWDVSSANTVKSIIPGGENHNLFKRWLDNLAAFFLSLKDDQGKLIPVFFRPYHENYGSWFWWGQKFCTPEEYINLWKFTFQYLTESKGVHNILFTYSPDGGFNTKDEYLIRYPGDNFVDMIGFDTYQFGINNKVFIDSVVKKLKILCEIAKEKNKVSAITEIGYESITDSLWWTEVLWKAIENSDISYILTWRNAHDRPKHFFAPFPEQISARDFVEFYKLERTLFMGDITP